MKIKLLIIFFIIFSCISGKAQKKWDFSIKQQIRWWFDPESMFDAENPHFRPNGGAKEVNFFNKRKSKKETKFIENYKLKLEIEKQREKLGEMVEIFEKTGIDEELGEATAQLKKELDILINKYYVIANSALEELELNKKRLELLIEINDLKKKLTDPLSILALKSKEINTIKADFSFETGSSELTSSGKNQVENILKQIYHDIDQWFYYLDFHDEAVFRRDNYIVRIFVKGYTDEQGYTSANNKNERIYLNKKLSDDRAYSVRTEIHNKFNKSYRDLTITLSIEYIGMGEQLPPGVYYGPKDDQKRRICTVGTLVGPKSLIKLK